MRDKILNSLLAAAVVAGGLFALPWVARGQGISPGGPGGAAGGGGSIPGSGLTAFDVYFVASNGLMPASAWGFPSAGATATFTNSSASIGATNSLYAGALVQLSTTGTLPTGFAVNTTYCVIPTGLSGSAFELASACGGSAITAGSAGSGTQTVFSVPTSPAIGIAATTTAVNTAGNTVTNGSWTWTVGLPVCVSDVTPGTLTQTCPTASGHFVDYVGVPILATQILINPSMLVGTRP